MKDIQPIIVERLIIAVLMLLILAGTLWAVADRINANEQCNVRCQQDRLDAE